MSYNSKIKTGSTGKTSFRISECGQECENSCGIVCADSCNSSCGDNCRGGCEGNCRDGCGVTGAMSALSIKNK